MDEITDLNNEPVKLRKPDEAKGEESEQSTAAEIAECKTDVDEKKECCCCHIDYRDMMKKLFLPWSEDCGCKLEQAPKWLVTLAALALFIMLNQVKVPVAGGKVAFADLAFIVAFIPIFIYYIRSKRGFFYPLLGVVALAVACFANIASAPGVGAIIDIAQLIQQLLCGVLLFSFLVENAPCAAVVSVTLALLVNIIVALPQAFEFGFGSAYPPADILKLKWRFGAAYTGLFRSRMAFGFFLAAGIAWLQPILFGRKKVIGTIAAVVMTVICLLAISHGQMLFIACLVLLPGAFIHSRRAGIANVIAMLIALFISFTVLNPSHNKAVLDTFNPMKTGDYPGELKTNHIDFAAALNMAERKPLCGVGTGRYQQCVGRCYGDLPNPSYNDIDTDTQASVGILAGTMGYPVAALMLILIASTAACGVRRFLSSEGVNTVALGGALALAVVFLGMFVSDPFTRGLGWMVALALASASIPNPSEAIIPFRRVSAPSVIAFGLVLALLLGCVALRDKADDPLKGTTQAIADDNANGDAASGAQEESVFKVIDAAEVASFTPPVEKGTDSQAAKNTVLKILDGKGTPPDGKEPAMEFGGAVFNFEIASAASCKVWLRVWWDGSCGNTINVKMDDEAKSATVGNDGTYRTWHWMEAPKQYKLEPGKHTITLLNREDGIMFDQLLITNDLQYVPQEIEEE